MSYPTKNQSGPVAIKSFMATPAVQSKLKELMDKNASAFATSIMQVVNSTPALQDATPVSILNAACMAATLNLPINKELGFAYIVPYKNKGQSEAQFQLGYKGFIQLAQRSGQFKYIEVCAVYEHDDDDDVIKRLTSFIPRKGQGAVIGYIAYFKLLNGYETRLFMDMQELEAHATKYSKSYGSKYGKSGVWADNFEAMAKKTVLKLLLSQKAPMSIDLQKAVLADQAVIKDIEGTEYEYIDNQPSEPTMLMPVDDALFETLKSNILTGDIEVSAVLNGKYDLSDAQRQEIKNL